MRNVGRRRLCAATPDFIDRPSLTSAVVAVAVATAEGIDLPTPERALPSSASSAVGVLSNALDLVMCSHFRFGDAVDILVVY